uniref:Mitochondrial import inner membrane translocase subunit TIM23 n=1 Tax=Plectus sambesii TaxID=2011161 RepID=A0A914URZ2_9BILA
MSNDSGMMNAPVFPLDQIRNAGLPLGQQISPYLQVDPSIFRTSEPQYILPEGASPKRGRLELAFGQIGGAVGGGYLLGMARGTLPELRKNQDFKNWKPFGTRVVNAAVKHGSAWAQPIGTAVLLYSGCAVLMSYVRPDDELNSVFSGALAGGIFRCAHGTKAIAKGAGVGAGIAAAVTLLFIDREKVKDMLHLN